jgi:hypothetical protein
MLFLIVYLAYGIHDALDYVSPSLEMDFTYPHVWLKLVSFGGY